GRAARRPIAIDDLSMSGALVRTDTRLAREERVTLALSGVSARSRRIALPARVVRAEKRASGGPDGGWAIGLQFTGGEPLRSRIAGLLADLPPERSLPERRP
ncbi:MAG TPA: PilZ domain-containing protein, partial [Candidatus Polarisedimenticolia bacterium]|nr:PilZ domain-containing protein [Candidatus Polarisedimenticolia bacterium]